MGYNKMFTLIGNNGYNVYSDHEFELTKSKLFWKLIFKL